MNDINHSASDVKRTWKELLNLVQLDDISSDEGDLFDDPALVLVVLEMFDNAKRHRAIKWINKRINWNEHVEREQHTKTFESKYHMPLASFNRLVNLLRPAITLDYVKSINSTSGNTPIYPELIVAASLRYLGGEYIKSLEDIFGVDDSSLPRLIDLFFDAVERCPSLAIKLPTTRAELDEVAAGFNCISSADGLFNGCVGAIDGWLSFTIQPIDRDIVNKRDYYSGHYSSFGLNCQAICDHKLRFIYFSVAAPGMTNDARAIMKCIGLCRWIKSLENGPFFLVGDNAYTLSDQLLIPFSGNSLTESERTYNYYLSQMRIRIEMAFGRLTTKWRIFRRCLENGTRKNSRICRVAAALHNYVINETDPDETEEGFIIEHPAAPEGSDLGYTPTVDDPNETNATGEGSSLRRTAFVRIVARDGMSRPQHNINRNG